MSTDVVVFRYKVTNDTQRIYTDSLGRDNLVSPGLFLQYDASPALFGPLPDLGFRGDGIWTYTETWTAEVDPALSGILSGANLFGGVPGWSSVGGSTIGGSADVATTSQDTRFFRTPTAMRVKVELESPTGSYEKEVRFTGTGVRTMPSKSPTTAFGSAATGRANGLAGMTNHANVQKQTIEIEQYGQEPPFASINGTINGLTSGRYAKYQQSGGVFVGEAGSGDPLSNPGDVVQAVTYNRWVDPWSYTLRFDLVDLAGNAPLKQVLFLKRVDANSNPLEVVSKAGSFEETVSQGYQWVESRGSLRRFVGGLGGIVAENIDESGHALTATPAYPMFGVMMPGSTIRGAPVPDLSFIPDWEGGDWAKLYDNQATEVPYPLLGIMRPPAQGKRYPLSSSYNSDCEFILRNVKLRQRTELTRQPSNWSIAIAVGGSSVSGNELTAGGYTRFDATPIGVPSFFGFVHPYRYLSFDAVADSAGDIEVWLFQPAPGAQAIKAYRARVAAGASRVWIDTCNPYKYYVGPPGTPDFLEGSEMSRVDGQNVEIGLPGLVSTGRFGGINTLSQVSIFFEDNVVTVSNWGGEVRYGAQARQSAPMFSYDPFKLVGDLGGDYDDAQNPDYMFYGHVDGKDAFRSRDLVKGGIAGGNYPACLTLAGAYPVPTGLSVPPHVDRNGSLWPLVDAVGAGVDVNYSFYYGKFGSSFIGAGEVSVWGGTPSFHCSMPWGNALSVTTPRAGLAELRRELFDDTLVENLDIDASATGYATSALANYFPSSVFPFVWGSTPPAESFGIQPVQKYHLRYYDRNDPAPFDYLKQVEALTWGGVYWCGLLAKPLAGGAFNPWNMQSWLGRLHRCHIEDGDVQYWRSRWSSASYGFDLQVEATSSGDCRDPRMCQRQDGRIFLCYQRGDSGTYERYSDDEGASWSDEEEMISGGKHPMNVCGRLNQLVRAAFVPSSGTDGPGTIKATVQGPGDPSPSALKTFADDNGDEIIFADDTFGLCQDEDGAARWHLTAVVEGESEPSDWFSADEADFTFKRV